MSLPAWKNISPSKPNIFVLKHAGLRQSVQDNRMLWQAKKTEFEKKKQRRGYLILSKMSEKLVK